jgi:hypothetical protein
MLPLPQRQGTDRTHDSRLKAAPGKLSCERRELKNLSVSLESIQNSCQNTLERRKQSLLKTRKTIRYDKIGSLLSTYSPLLWAWLSPSSYTWRYQSSGIMLATCDSRLSMGFPYDVFHGVGNMGMGEPLLFPGFTAEGKQRSKKGLGHSITAT